MHHVCLIQSISARKATHIKLGTHSGSSQCQLHFGTKMVSIGWSGCEWLPSECKNAHFQAFLPLAPSDIILIWFWPTVCIGVDNLSMGCIMLKIELARTVYVHLYVQDSFSNIPHSWFWSSLCKMWQRGTCSGQRCHCTPSTPSCPLWWPACAATCLPFSHSADQK